MNEQPQRSGVQIKPRQAYYDILAQAVPPEKLNQQEGGLVAFKLTDADPEVLAAIVLELLIDVRDLTVMVMQATGKAQVGSQSGLLLPGQR